MIEPLLSDDAFLADVEAASAEPAALHLWWLGQSGFLVKYRGRHLLFDPYLSDSLTKKYADTNKPHVRMSRRVVDPAKLDFVDLITSTHNHTDHLDRETINTIVRASVMRLWKGLDFGVPVTTLLFPAANEAFVHERLTDVPVHFQPLSAWEKFTLHHDDFTAVPAAHPEFSLDTLGRHPYLGFVAKIGPFTIYHSGDTVVFDGMAEGLRRFNIDLAILPINGKVGNMNGRDAAKLAHDIGAKRVIPCHYDLFEFNTANPHDEFVPECERLGQPYTVLQLGERLSLRREGESK